MSGKTLSQAARGQSKTIHRLFEVCDRRRTMPSGSKTCTELHSHLLISDIRTDWAVATPCWHAIPFEDGTSATTTHN